MPINLLKDASTSIPAMDPIVTIAFEWEHVIVARKPIDCDLSIAMLDGMTGRMPTDRALVFYNNPQSEDGAVLHRGDALEGGRVDEAEIIELALGKVRPTVSHLYVFVTVYGHAEREHSLADLSRAVFRIRRGTSGATLLRMPIPPEPLTVAADACLVGRFSRTESGWMFEQQWAPFVGGLAVVVERYGPA
jgi:tellurium resistance protein TerD